MAELKVCPCCGRPMAVDPIRANKGRKTPVVSISENGERTRYESINEAAKAIKASTCQIFRAVNFGQMCRGMRWVKESEDDGR